MIPFERARPQPAADLVYESMPVRRRYFRIVAVLLALTSLLPPLFFGDTGSLGAYAVSALACCVAWGIPFWITLLTLWSVNRYGRIQITRRVLRVGRHQIPLTAIDTQVSRDLQLGTAELDALVRQRSHIRRMGGAYDTPAGMGAVLLPLVDGTAALMDCRDRQGLLTALRSVLGQPPH